MDAGRGHCPFTGHSRCRGLRAAPHSLLCWSQSPDRAGISLDDRRHRHRDQLQGAREGTTAHGIFPRERGGQRTGRGNRRRAANCSRDGNAGRLLDGSGAVAPGRRRPAPAAGSSVGWRAGISRPGGRDHGVPTVESFGLWLGGPRRGPTTFDLVGRLVALHRERRPDCAGTRGCHAGGKLGFNGPGTAPRAARR